MLPYLHLMQNVKHPGLVKITKCDLNCAPGMGNNGIKQGEIHTIPTKSPQCEIRAIG